MYRHLIYELIDKERAYQDSLGSDRTDGRRHNVGEELILMEVYLRKAFDAWAYNPGDSHSLKHILQVAAIAVRAMEGAPIEDLERIDDGT